MPPTLQRQSPFNVAYVTESMHLSLHFTSSAFILFLFAREHDYFVVLVVQWLGVGLVIEMSLVRLLAGVLSSQLGQLSLPSLRGR